MILSDIKVKAEKFSTYGYHGKKIKDSNRSNKITHNQIYELTFHGIAKIMTVRDKYECIMGSPWIQIQKSNRQLDLHPFFVYLIKTLKNYDAISLLKITDFNPNMLREIIKKEDEERGYPTFKIKQLFSCETMQQIYKKIKGKKDRLQRLKWLHYQMKNDELACKMKYKELLKRGYKQLIIEKITRNKETSTQMLEIFGQKLFQQVKAIQLIRKSYQTIKLQLFEMKHKKYYLTSFPTKKQIENQSLNSIYIKKPASEPALLHTLEEHVRNREDIQLNKLNAMCRPLLKRLVQELKQYTNKVSYEQFRGLYEFLQPKNVLLDPVSLKPKLSFNPMLLDALGLKNRPMNIENMLVFFPTPQTFDYFQVTPFMENQNNTNLENQLILNDPFYGCMDLFGDEKNNLQEGQVKEICDVERVRLQQTKQKILVWRILLTSYYLIHGKQFGLITNGNRAQNLQYFKEKINTVSYQLKKNINNLEMFLSPTALQKEKRKNQAQQQSQQFNFTFEQLYNYLGLNQESDDIVQDLKYKKIKRYHELRKLLLREITKILRADYLFNRLYNVKKYMIIYCVIALEMVEQTYETLSAQQKLSGERKLLMENFDKYIRKLRNQKTYIETLNSTFSKVEKYRKERDQGDKQAAFITKDQEGLKMFQHLKKIKNFVNNLAELNEELNKMESSIKEKDQIKSGAEETSNNQMKKKYKIELENTFQNLNSYIQTIRSLCYEVALTCFKAMQPEELHKYDRNSETSKESYRIYSIEFEITLKIFFSLQSKHLLNYETLIIPYLNLDEQQKKPEAKRIESKIQRQSKLKLFEFINDLLRPNILRLTSQPKENQIVLYKIYSNQSKPTEIHKQQQETTINDELIETEQQERSIQYESSQEWLGN